MGLWLALAPLVFVAWAACKAPPPPAPRPLSPLPPALSTGPDAGAGLLWHYEVRATQGAAELRIEAVFPPGTPAKFAVDPGFESYVRDVEVAQGSLFVPVDQKDRGWRAEGCPQTGCRLRYRFLLAEAAEATGDVDQATSRGQSYLATPPTWVLRPDEEVDNARIRLHVSCPPGVHFVTGIFPSSDGVADTYEADADDLDNGPYSGFGPFAPQVATVMGGRLEVAVVPGGFQRSQKEFLAWAVRSAQVVGSYFAQFPVPRLALFVLPTRGSRIGLGTAMGHGGAAIVVFVGREISLADLMDDWVLPHEMIHLGMSPLSRRHRWLKEGIATYVGPVVCARAGEETPAQVWRGFFESMKEGLPGWRDKGLDNTPTWGRVYWGGALFCLLADVEIRERTQNRKSLADAFRAIVKAGGNISVEWDILRLLAEGDRGTGVPVLTELYEKMANQPVPVDLPGLWRRLGIAEQGDSVRFDDHAPLAAIRLAITAPAREFRDLPRPRRIYWHPRRGRL